MTRRIGPLCITLLFATAALMGAEPAADADDPAMPLPPGWTDKDMQACMIAASPGEMHKKLTDQAGTWHGKNTMWMFPGSEPMHSESVTTVTPILDGRFVQVESRGQMPGGMGAFHGLGLYGYDNIAQRFVGTWIDNMGTTMAQGTGELSEDGRTLTFNYTYTCPVTGKPAKLREVETWTGPNSKTLAMYMTEPRSGEVYKVVHIEMTRAAEVAPPAGP